MSKSMSRRGFLRSAALLGAGVLAAACQPEVVEVEKVVKETVVVSESVEKEVTRVVEAQPAGEGMITITVLSRAGYLGDAHRMFFTKFQKDHPNVRIKEIETSYAEIPTKGEAMYRSGEFPDVSYQAVKWFPYLVHKGLFAPLDDLVEARGEEIDYEDFYPGFVNALRFEDKLYGLPEFCFPTSRCFVLLNLDLFEEAGVPVPEGPDWSLDDWRDAAIKLTNPAKNIFGMDPPNLTYYYDWDAFVDGFDTHIIDEPVGFGKRFNFLDNPKNKEAVDWYLSVMEAHAAPRRGEVVPNVNMFAAGLYATHKEGPGIPSLIKEIGERFRWGTVLMRGPVRRGTGVFANNWSISSQCKHMDEAFTLVGNYLCGKEIGPYSFETGLGLGLQGRRSEWNSDIVTNAHPAYGIMRDWLNEENESFNPFPHPYNLRYQEVYDTYENNVQPLAYLEKTWDEQAPIIQQKVQEVMDQPRG